MLDVYTEYVDFENHHNLGGRGAKRRIASEKFGFVIDVACWPACWGVTRDSVPRIHR